MGIYKTKIQRGKICSYLDSLGPHQVQKNLRTTFTGTVSQEKCVILYSPHGWCALRFNIRTAYRSSIFRISFTMCWFIKRFLFTHCKSFITGHISVSFHCCNVSVTFTVQFRQQIRQSLHFLTYNVNVLVSNWHIIISKKLHTK